jgi:sarcosine oxidase, subunit alpha
MTTYRLEKHPILTIPADGDIPIYWQGKTLAAKPGEMISAALFANGIRVFGHHPKDGSPQGIFCANGQCSQCLVRVDGLAVKACMTPVKAGMRIDPLEDLPTLKYAAPVPPYRPTVTLRVECLIIGGGPAGLSAAVELGKCGVQTLLVDDKHSLGGKLVLQTHRFFGSIEACYAGVRGIDIGQRLAEEVARCPSVTTWTNSIALAVFSDQKVGILRESRDYVLIEPKVLLVAAGAREKSLTFRGNTLPGVYGAGAFQTLVNRDTVRAAEKLFIIGGGNVGLIAGYHALQAGISVVGLVEALPECGGYKVHKDKLVRMGVPIYTSHTVVSANGEGAVESVTIAQVDQAWQTIPGTERTFACDTLLIAVGLDPVNEFLIKAQEFGLPALAAGDADEVAEASAAMYSGRIRGQEAAALLGHESGDSHPEWYQTVEILKSRPGEIGREAIPDNGDIFPVLHCSQEIPCNPCTSVCPQKAIVMDEGDIRKLPRYIASELGVECLGCEKCVVVCPGLAITLVDKRSKNGQAIVTLPYELGQTGIKAGDKVFVTDTAGTVLDEVEVVRVRSAKVNDRTVLVKVKAPLEIATRIAGLRVQEPDVTRQLDHWVERLADDTILCRCERVTVGQVKDLIRAGIRDVNEIKAITRAGMGACGSKTCGPLFERAFRELGVSLQSVTANVRRPLFIEVPLGFFAGVEDKDQS